VCTGIAFCSGAGREGHALIASDMAFGRATARNASRAPVRIMAQVFLSVGSWVLLLRESAVRRSV